MTIALSAYQYNSLLNSQDVELDEDPNGFQIRLVNLLPGKFHEPIKLKIHRKSLDEAVKLNYTALSYTWGDPDNKVSITVCQDGAPETLLSVTRNLSMALRYLRHRPGNETPGESESDDDVWIWIDALCINQADRKEKTWQVSKMVDIYRSAFNVKIWLGLAEDDSDEAMEALQLGKRIDVTFEDDGHLRLRRSIEAIALRKYWSRVWVVQEIVVSKRPKIKCGEKEVEWKTAVEAFGKYLKNRDEKLKQRPEQTQSGGAPQSRRKNKKASTRTQRLDTRPITTIERLSSYRDRHGSAKVGKTTGQPGGEKRGWLLDMLLNTRHFGAYEPKDKIFSLLGLNVSELQSPCYSPPLEAKYELSFLDVSVRLFNHCVHTPQNDSTFNDPTPGRLDIICASQPDIKSEWPTWLPDFSKDNGMKRWPPQRELSEIGKSEIQKLSFSLDNRILQVCGARVAEIHKATDSRDDCLATDDWSLLARLRLAIELVSGTFSPDFWGSLILDKSLKLDWKKDLEKEDNASVLELLQDAIEDSKGHSTTTELMFLNEFRRMSRHRRFAVFTDSHMGMVPGGAREGDEVYWLTGCNYLVILRRLVPGVQVSSFQFVGPCYVSKPPSSWTKMKVEEEEEGKKEEDLLIL